MCIDIYIHKNYFWFFNSNIAFSIYLHKHICTMLHIYNSFILHNIIQKSFQMEIDEYYILETNKELLESITIEYIRKALT